MRKYKAIHEETSIWMREDVEGQPAERKKVNREAKEEERSANKKGWLWFVNASGTESEHWCEVSACVPASVPTVVDLLSLVNMVPDVVVSVPDCEVMKPQTFSLSRKRDAGVALERETKMNIEGRPVNAVPRPTPQSSRSKAVNDLVARARILFY